MDVKKYKVQGDSKNAFMDIELNLCLEDDSIGAHCKVLGGDFTITQNGSILVLVDKDWCLTLMDITPEPEPEEETFVVNRDFDIYFKTKEIAVRKRVSYEDLYYALKEEWKLTELLRPEPFPFEYSNRLQLFTFLNDWNFEDGSFPNMIKGSFSRKNANGTNI